MAKIIIDIDDNLYTRLFDNGVDNYDDVAADMAKAIRKSTILPKGHKRLIDTSDLCLAIAARMFNIEAVNSIPIKDLQDVIDNETITIIEADKEEQ